MIAIIKIFIYNILLFNLVFSAEPVKAEEFSDYNQEVSTESLGRIGDYTPPTNPQYDRAKGYLLKGKVRSAVSNSGNFITWDQHPAGFWGKYGYLPHLGFVAGIPGHEYSSAWSDPGDPSWVQETSYSAQLWYSKEAYNNWMKGVDEDDFETEGGNYKTIVYNTVVDRGADERGHNDRGDIGLEIKGYCADPDNVYTNMNDCESAGFQWTRPSPGRIDPSGGVQWFLDHDLFRLYLYLEAGSNPNYASAGIGLAFPWAIRPKFNSRNDAAGGFYFDRYEYGDDNEEWTDDDEYVYYGATFDESWFIQDSPFGSPAVKTDWQATTKSRYNSHNLNNIAGDLFGTTEFTDSSDPDALLAHSKYPETWPTQYSFDTGSEIPFWPGWWADEYYGESPDLWSTVGIYDCNGTREDDGCWKPLPDRHISDMDVYMEFDDRWANVGNNVVDNEYVSAGYPMGLKVRSMVHSYGVAYAEDVMFVTVKVRNESGDYCAFERDKNQMEIYIKDENDFTVCEEGMIMPDGTKLNRGKGFDYKKLYLGFYMDADVLATDATGNTSVHTNADDFMQYIDCKISKTEYPDGCPVVNNDTLRISMAVIGDYDGASRGPLGYSMQENENKGPEFGVVAVQLLDSPYSTGYVDLDQDGYWDIYPGEKLKMTDWHWFDWFRRPGVSSYGGSDAPAVNKELIQYQVIAGDNTNLTSKEKTSYFHADDPSTDFDSDINPHFDSLEGIKETEFFKDEDDGLDCVLEMSTGPFDLKVGEEVSFSFCLIYGQNIDDLLRNAYFAQIMYNSHYQGYTPPSTPNVMAVSGPNRVELYWDDVSLYSRDVITGYSDFEGYKIYRSIDGGNTWGANEDEILIENDSKGWQPLSIGCFDNPEDGDHLSDCSQQNSKRDCIFSDFTNFERRDADDDNIDDCFWKYAQFDLSTESDSLFCIFGKDPEGGDCISTEDCPAPCIRKADVQGPDPEAEWFSLGYNTGLDVLLLDQDNPDSVLIVIDDNGDTQKYKYKFVDDNVIDGIEYTYSVVAYDRGVSQEVITFYPSDDGDTLFTREASSIPDPGGWGEINPFELLESPKGTTVHDPNFLKVNPGYLPENTLDEIMVVPNPYIVHSDYNETEYKKKIRFTRLPETCTITIFTVSGEKVRELDHNSLVDGNTWWDLRCYNNQEIAPGLYIYVVETPGGESKIGKFAIVR